MSPPYPSSLPPSPSDVLLRADGLTKLFRTRRARRWGWHFIRAVDNVSLWVNAGETLAVVGESGSGKTTLGRLLLRLLEPTFGQIVFDGELISELPERALRPIRRHLQPVFQDPYETLNPKQQLLDIVSEGIQIHRLAASPEQVRERVIATLDRVGLAPSVLHLIPSALSAGDRQRVGIARALAVSPKFMVCDEPMSALDVSVQAQLANLLLEVQEQSQLAYLLITHNMRLVAHLSHRIAVMYCGGIIETGPTQSVYTHRLHPYSRALFAAVPPSVGPGRRLRIILEGEPPNPASPPAGCTFHPRCPRAEQGLCDVEAPPLQEFSGEPGHFVACYHPHL